MRAFIAFLMSPYNWYILLFLVITLLAILKKRKLAIIVFYATFAIILLTSTSFIPGALTRSLEKGYAPLDISSIEPDSSQLIIVLGGGFSDNLEFPVTQRLPESAMGRLIEGVRIHKTIPGSKIIVTGDAGKAKITQAQVMEEAAYALGASEVVKLPEPDNTLSEAASFSAYFGNDNTPILVTDANHMPRAIYLFEALDMHPIPAPTNFIHKGGTKKYNFLWLPSTGNIDLFGLYIREKVAMMAAKFETRKFRKVESPS